MAPAMAVVQLILPPKWTELSPQKQRILAPLAGDWNQMEATRKRKWLEIAERYPQMNQTEQDRVQRRMKAWAHLTPDERRIAREKYRHLKQASPEQREVLRNKWSEYQKLPLEEKQRFKESAAAKAATKASPAAGADRNAKLAPIKPSLVQVPEPAATATQPPTALRSIPASPGPTSVTPP
jgi:hypothetical protein